MTEVAYSFDDSAGYEQFMGRWSKAAGALFLDWLGAPEQARWLDVGCGTGAFTGLILDKCRPASVIGIDPSAQQIGYARRQSVAKRVPFHVADAGSLPFRDGTFDVVAAALALNFMPDRPLALREMRRVARVSGLVAGYVWDFAQELSPSWPMRVAMRKLYGEETEAPGLEASTASALCTLFERVGFQDIHVVSFEVTLGFDDFADFWAAQTVGRLPVARRVAALVIEDQLRLSDAVRTMLRHRPDGGVEYSARATGVKARPVI